jgi:hypothetical protein
MRRWDEIGNWTMLVAKNNLTRGRGERGETEGLLMIMKYIYSSPCVSAPPREKNNKEVEI